MAFKGKTQKKTVICDTVVQIPLLPEVVQELLTLTGNLQSLVVEFEKPVKQGYSLQIQYDPDRNQFHARFAGVTEGLPNAGKLLYGNGDTIELAILSLYGKHFLQSEGGLWKDVSNSGSKMS